ncbi:hypothetical protein [Vibrio cholerae]|uniref:hypothetical protein n=1 Tax=Vibrio cholerae TaxID=666 RepID=UPI0029C29DDC|nr:hypothetical protein [Vibrio cholerae]MDX5049862.1 hypothetical protein [Vibrio cholerae]MVF55328.1 hypothetical protein [Vibrio cholerae]
MQSKDNGYVKGTLNLKAVVSSKLRSSLAAIEARTNDGLLTAAEFMYPMSLSGGYTLNKSKESSMSCMALPITSQWLLSHLISEKCVAIPFKNLRDKMDEIVPLQSDEPISQYLIDKSTNSENHEIDLPECIQIALKNTPYLQLSSNQMHLALSELSKTSTVSEQTVHSMQLMKDMLSSQFSAAVKDVNFDMFSTPDEANRQQATDDLIAAIMKAGKSR